MGLCPTDKTIGHDGLDSSETVHWMLKMHYVVGFTLNSEQNKDIRSL